MGSNSARLSRTLGAFQNWLYLPDPGMVEITLATVAANRIAGDPVWLLLTAPPSSGKTEVLNSLSGLPDMHAVSTLTEAALLSGTSRRDRTPDATGGLLLEIGEFGILVLKDFTSILSMNREKQKALFGALREIYDGKWDRPVGADGGRKLVWQGKLGLIGAVTSAIDSHHAVMASMGPRFTLFRPAALDPEAQARRAIEKTSHEKEMRADLIGEVAEFFEGIDFSNPPALCSEQQGWITSLTTLVATCRSAVDRDSYSRDIELIHDPEAPARLTRTLAQLLVGLQMIGVTPQRARELIVKVGLDCIPPVRRIGLEALLNQQSSLTTGEIAGLTGYPEQTIRRSLQDLKCHGIVDLQRHGVPEKWQVVELWQERFRIARGAFPKSS